MNIMIRTLTLCLLMALAFPALVTPISAAAASNELLPADQAFTYRVSDDAGELVIDWQVQPGYYLYQDKLSFSFENSSAQADLPLLPRGQTHEDEFFGEKVIYAEDFQVRLPYTANGNETTTLLIASQGCSSEFGICFPPQKWTVSVPLTPTASVTTNSAPPSLFGQSQDEPLPVDVVFTPQITGIEGNAIEVGWQIKSGYYLYKPEIQAHFAETDQIVVTEMTLPDGKTKFDESFGDTQVFYDDVFANLTIARLGAATQASTLTLRYQGCKENSICYPPVEKSFAVTLPAGKAVASLPPAYDAPPQAASTNAAPDADAPPQSEQAKLAALISNGNLFAVLGTFFLAGLVLSLTPCVLPMVPILSGIIAGDGDNVTPMRGFTLALIYVLGMALTYTVAGAAFAAAGQQAQTVFQQPWILVTFAGLFVVLSLSMFGLFEMQMPSSIQTRLSQISGNQRSGTAVGAFVMGALSSLVVTACVAPPLVAALAVIGQSGDVVRGGLALFSLSIGMGVPLLIVGASAGRLLPKAGAWMVTVKQAFGFVMLGLAIWMLSRLLPEGVILLLWAVLIFVAGVFLGAMSPLGEQAGAPQRLGKGFAMLATLYGAVLFVGALTGGTDPLQPLKGSILEARVLPGSAGTTADKLVFTKIKTTADLDAAIARANGSGQSVMLDFYADWCVSCKEMEKYTFTDSAVIAALDNTVLLKADVTANDDADKALLKRFGIFGPPSIIFFDAAGIERPAYQVVGFMKPERFAPHVQQAVAAPLATVQAHQP